MIGRRWLQHRWAALAGTRGRSRASLAWTVVVVPALVVVVLSPVLAVPLFAAAVGFSLRAALRQPRRWWPVVLVGALTIWVTCWAAALWLHGVGLDAADAVQPRPSVARWAAPSFWIGLAAFATSWVALVPTLRDRPLPPRRQRGTGFREVGG